MIAYEDLVVALTNWRVAQGLPSMAVSFLDNSTLGSIVDTQPEVIADDEGFVVEEEEYSAEFAGDSEVDELPPIASLSVATPMPDSPMPPRPPSYSDDIDTQYGDVLLDTPAMTGGDYTQELSAQDIEESLPEVGSAISDGSIDYGDEDGIEEATVMGLGPELLPPQQDPDTVMDLDEEIDLDDGIEPLGDPPTVLD